MPFWLYFQFWRVSAKLTFDLPALGVHLLLRRTTSGLDPLEPLPAPPAASSAPAARLAARKLAARELAARGLAARELAARELAARELAARKLAARELAARELDAGRAGIWQSWKLAELAAGRAGGR
jgi:hypothetical protein